MKPLRSIAPVDAPSALPIPLTTFIGRATDVVAVRGLLDRDDVRLLTLTGAGGVGKTRLALEAIDHARGYPDGIWFVPLAAVRDPSLVLSTIASALDLSLLGKHPVESLLATYLRSRQALVMLDNFEHVLDAAPCLSDLLRACPKLKILVTSRTNLRVSAERVFTVTPLGLPEHQPHCTITDIEQSESVQLFIDRATARVSTFVLTSDIADAVASICRRLDGLPLAIELAAAYVGVLTPAALDAHLQDRLASLANGPRDLPARQQTIRAAIAWSYDLLSPDVQRFFWRMSAFFGGFTLDGAERVGGLSSHADLDTLTAIGTLVDSCLLRTVEGPGGEPRYVMLETIREFGLEQLAASGEHAVARQHHAEWCLSLARRTPTEPGLHDQQVEAMQWVDRQDADFANLRSALHWLDGSGQTDALAEMVMSLRMLWGFGGHDLEGLRWYRRVLDLPLAEASPIRIKALTAVGSITLNLDNGEAERLLAAALALARRIGDLKGEAWALHGLGVAAEERGDYGMAESRYRAARRLFEQTGDVWTMAFADFDAGVFAYARGELSDAVATFEHSSASAEAIGDQFIPAWCNYHLALIACEQGRPERAAALLKPLFSRHHPGSRRPDPSWLACAAMVAAAVDDDASAARLFGAAEAASRGYPLSALDRRKCEPVATSVRERLGADAHDVEWESGQRMREADIRDEVHRVLTRAAQPPEPKPAGATGSRITDRELEVLRLLVDGRSDAEIAAALFISRRTAENHVAHIYQKLDVSGRAAAAAWAVRHGLA